MYNLRKFPAQESSNYNNTGIIPHIHMIYIYMYIQQRNAIKAICNLQYWMFELYTPNEVFKGFRFPPVKAKHPVPAVCAP